MSAAASSRVGLGFGGGNGGGVRRSTGVRAFAGTDLDLALRAGAGDFLAATLTGFFAAWGLETGRFLATTVFFLVVARLFDVTIAPAFFAFLAGALPEAERLVIGFGRTDLPARLRLLLVDAEDGREVERNGDLLTPLTIGLLM